ncbi:probable 2-oxoglutarate-dependent dioxygenase AOP1 [Coffea arabica]|uniref:Probable 2-oxoglutarate-dependent dioxygenase AOP1 n=1 Tax=Coffea arabica TaxID=13443 RepID=A0A6P6X703_COFAR
MGSLAQHKLPVIDFTKKNLDPGSSSWLSTRQAVVGAMEEYGCFIALYDKVSLELHEAIFRASEDLFDLPTETKLLNTCHKPAPGYVGQNPRFPLYESLGIDDATSIDGVQKFTTLMWPNGNDSFCESAFSYSKLVAELDQMVMRMVSETYGVEKSYETLLGSTSYLLRLIKYREPQENETNLGIVPHTDKSFMSILQQHQVKGLEIKTKDGRWMEIDPFPSSFIIMAGEAFMAWTNGRIEAPHHRVIMPGNAERYSVGLFTFIWDLLIQVPEELVDVEHPLQFKPFDHHKFHQFHTTEEGMRSKCAIKSYCGV